MGRTEEVSAAIADETEITAIEEAGIIAQSKSAEADDNPADRRLPLIARIFCGVCPYGLPRKFRYICKRQKQFDI